MLHRVGSVSGNRLKRISLLCALVGFLPAAASASSETRIGERPTIETHMAQERIDGGYIGLGELIAHGQLLFNARFNRLDGQGRPATRGDGVPRIPNQPDFIRTSAPDANSCTGCHNQPEPGGAGEFVANVFVLAQTLDPVTESVGPASSNERNTLGMHGSGPIEMLAREMTADLLALRAEAYREAAATGAPATRALVTKGVRFGTIRVMPDGKVDPSGIEGVDCDLIVKPFHQKGAVVSLREFSNNAMNHHHGMQSTERFGLGQDPDGDGVVNELTVGDITAVTIFQAALSTPGVVMPKDPRRRAAAERGEQLFAVVRCTECHIPALELNSPFFTEPNPYNPPGNLRPRDVSQPFSFDMTKEGLGNRLERSASGGAIVRAYTDLKRHNLNDADYHHFQNERVPQGNLRGFASDAEFTRSLPARPTSEFLTRKLWDVGNTDPYGHRGDLTTITEAIYYHGGEARGSRDAFFALPQEDRDAIVEFLMTLQVLPSAVPAQFDANQDGRVDAKDLMLFIRQWHR